MSFNLLASRFTPSSSEFWARYVSVFRKASEKKDMIARFLYDDEREVITL